MRRQKDIVGGLLFLGLAALAIGAVAHLQFGDARLPGPSALPIVLGSALGLLSVALIWSGLRGAHVVPSGPETDADPGGLIRIAAAASSIAIYTAILEVLGFLVATVALMTALFYLGAVRPGSLLPLLAALAVTAFSHILFVLLLDVRLPRGAFWG